MYDRTKIEAILREALLECTESITADSEEPEQLFHSVASRAIKQEMIEVGRKLWHRQYVDGNGGNISFRLSPQYVLCTPTLCSKADLCVDDFSLVDLDNRRVCGIRPQTSEILLHLEIYKAVPEARAVIHCHPPYATAHAIAGVLPPPNLIPEQEVFIGPVALAPYETPGTLAFARTVLPFVRQHNTVLLANHGVVCWADTVTHAEWYVEVIDTYCKTAMIASQLKTTLPEIPADKVEELLAIKKRLGLPDARFPSDGNGTSEITATEKSQAIAVQSTTMNSGQRVSCEAEREKQIEAIVDRVSSELLGYFGEAE